MKKFNRSIVLDFQGFQPRRQINAVRGYPFTYTSSFSPKTLAMQPWAGSQQDHVRKSSVAAYTADDFNIQVLFRPEPGVESFLL